MLRWIMAMHFRLMPVTVSTSLEMSQQARMYRSNGTLSEMSWPSSWRSPVVNVLAKHIVVKSNINYCNYRLTSSEIWTLAYLLSPLPFNVPFFLRACSFAMFISATSRREEPSTRAILVRYHNTSPISFNSNSRRAGVRSPSSLYIFFTWSAISPLALQATVHNIRL